MNTPSEQHLVQQRMEAKKRAEFSERPPFPRALNVELNNVCNHACNFCAYTLMEREKGSIDVNRLEAWLKEAYKLGSRDIGLHSGAEPFASKHLEHFVAYAKKIGYEYIYISTNGSLATPERMKQIIDAGIDSIKFSINAGNRDTYLKVHGKDHFERVIENLKFASAYRTEKKKPYLAISFVITQENHASLDDFRSLVGDLVDEFLAFPAANQSGQLAGDGEKAKKTADICPIPFNKLHISWEGFVRGCCNDYENMLALEDLSVMSLEEAFYSSRYQDWRKQHLEDKLEGTLCYNCKYDCKTAVQPLNPDLYFVTHESDLGPPVSHTPIIFKK
jgi:organic radical activating enzyme